jgi:GDP-4-dehydro-6-deoxy-D-mannose reductase
MFIHVGTGHPPESAIQNLARQLALIAKGKAEPVLHTGNLGSARDFIDVRDGVRAMMLLLEKGRPGQAVNICTGRAYKISEVLAMLLEISGLHVEVVQDPTLLRACDEPLLLGDNSKIKALGFVQHYPLEETLREVYHDWLERIV